MWDNFPILYFTKGRIKHESCGDSVNIYVNGKCVFRMIKVDGNLNNMRGRRCPLAIWDDSISSEEVEHIKTITGFAFNYEGRKNE